MKNTPDNSALPPNPTPTTQAFTTRYIPAEMKISDPFGRYDPDEDEAAGNSVTFGTVTQGQTTVPIIVGRRQRAFSNLANVDETPEMVDPRLYPAGVIYYGNNAALETDATFMDKIFEHRICTLRPETLKGEAWCEVKKYWIPFCDIAKTLELNPATKIDPCIIDLAFGVGLHYIRYRLCLWASAKETGFAHPEFLDKAQSERWLQEEGHCSHKELLDFIISMKSRYLKEPRYISKKRPFSDFGPCDGLALMKELEQHWSERVRQAISHGLFPAASTIRRGSEPVSPRSGWGARVRQFRRRTNEDR